MTNLLCCNGTPYSKIQATQSQKLTPSDLNRPLWTTPFILLGTLVIGGVLAGCSTGIGLAPNSDSSGERDPLSAESRSSSDSQSRSGSGRYVLGTGSGDSERIATDRALESAVEQAVGVWLASETELDEGILRERILTYAAGYVSGYDVIASEQNGEDSWSVKIGANVEQRQLRQSLDRVFPSSELLVSGLTEDWRAQAITKERMEKQGAEFVREVLKGLDETLFQVKLVGEPEIVDPGQVRGEIPRDGFAMLRCKFELSLDSDKYRHRILEPLKAVLAEYLVPSSPFQLPYENEFVYGGGAYEMDVGLGDSAGNHLYIFDKFTGNGRNGNYDVLDYNLPARFLEALDDSEFPDDVVRPGGYDKLGARIRVVSGDGVVLAEVNSTLGSGAYGGRFSQFPFLLRAETYRNSNKYRAFMSGDGFLMQYSDTFDAGLYSTHGLGFAWTFEYETQALLDIDRFQAQAILLPARQ